MANEDSFVKIANKIIEEKGGDAYKEKWLRTWLDNPDNEDKLMQSMMMKEISAEVNKKGKASKNEKTMIEVTI